ncbi:hypothetical protein PG991_011659 [Apiospora marii]|uniref:Uncharacterized protein n=1 Tax=Apiospora marii TaxID=335849 RepID=A0ABR1RFW4_9PEZI
MRALNPNVSKLTTVKEDDNNNRLTQPKLRTVSSRRSIIPSTASSSARSSSAPTATSAAAASSTLTSKPRPSSRQSAVSSSTVTATNNNNTTSRKPGALKQQPPSSSDSQRPQRTSASTATSRPPVITTTVTRNPRLAAAAAASSRTAAPRPAPLNLNSAPSRSSAPERSPAVVLSPASTTSNSSRTSTSSHATTTSALRSRDQHAPQMTQHSSISKPGRMPLDRTSGTNTNGTARMPTLSAGTARASNVGRVPLTPKIASKAPSTASVPAKTRTPLARTQPRPPIAGSVANGLSARTTTTQAEEEGPSLLSSNITPRSGKRQSRVNSASTTPNGTPNPERSADGWDHDGRSGVGAPSSPLRGEYPKRSSVTFSSIPNEAKAQLRQDDPDAKFFYASDAKGSKHHQQAAPVARPVLAKAPTFFHANGSAVDNNNNNKANQPPGSPAMTHTSSQDSLSGKFMYANGLPELPKSHPGSSSRPGSVISTTSRTAPTSRPRPGSQEISANQRPMSPIRSVQQPSSAPSRNNNLASSANNRPQAASPPVLGPSPAMLRRSSTVTSRKSHSRSSSMVSGSLVTGEPSRHSWISSGPASPSIDAALNPPPLTLASIIQAAEDLGDDPDETLSTVDDDQSETHSGVQSPTKSTHEAEPVSDLVANARRERKVQDLQITNASLEAINRTLERELRKQTAELRRFKRLSRAGRLSLMPVADSTHAPSETGSANGGDDQEVLSDLSEGEEPGDGPEEGDSLTDDDDTASDDGDLSASMLEEKDEKYGRKDEKRLQLDLTKHQQLLIDSQKINQSIKRCMDWTEELIKEGKKALEYSVRPYEVEIPGPRVLAPDADEDEDEDTTQTSISFDFDPDDTINLEEEATGPNAPITPRLAGWNPETNPMERA